MDNIKLTLNQCSLNDFLKYSRERMNTSTKEYAYLNNDVLTLGFEVFEKQNMTCHDNALCYRIVNGKRDVFSFGFSGKDINYKMETLKEIKEDLFHNLFCKIEWIARSKTETFYQDTVKEFLGYKIYKLFSAEGE